MCRPLHVTTGHLMTTTLMVVCLQALLVRGACPPGAGPLTLDVNLTITECTTEFGFTFASSSPGAVLTIERSDFGMISFGNGLDRVGVIVKDSTMRMIFSLSSGSMQDSFVVFENVIVLKASAPANALVLLKNREVSRSHFHLSRITVEDGPEGIPPFLVEIAKAEDVEVVIQDVSIVTSVVNVSVGVVQIIISSPVSRVNAHLKAIRIVASEDAHDVYAVDLHGGDTKNCTFIVEDISIDARMIDTSRSPWGLRSGLVEVNRGNHDAMQLVLKNWTSNTRVGIRRNLAMLDFISVGVLTNLFVLVTESTVVLDVDKAAVFGIRTDEPRPGEFPATASDANITLEHWHTSGSTGYGYEFLRWGASTRDASITLRNMTMDLLNALEDVIAIRLANTLNNSVVVGLDIDIKVSKPPLANPFDLNALVARAWMVEFMKARWVNVSLALNRASLRCSLGAGTLFGMPNQIWVCSYIYSSIALTTDPATFYNSSFTITDGYFEGQAFATNIISGNMTNFVDSSLTMDNFTIGRSTAFFAFTVIGAFDASLWDNMTVTLRNVKGDIGASAHGAAVFQFFYTSTVQNSRFIIEDVDFTVRTQLNPTFSVITSFLPKEMVSALLADGAEPVCSSAFLGVTHSSLVDHLNLTLRNSKFIGLSWAYARVLDFQSSTVTNSAFELINTTAMTTSNGTSDKHIGPSALLSLSVPLGPQITRSIEIAAEDSTFMFSSESIAGCHGVLATGSDSLAESLSVMMKNSALVLFSESPPSSLVQLEDGSTMRTALIAFDDSVGNVTSASSTVAVVNYTAGRSFEGSTTKFQNSRIHLNSSVASNVMVVENVTTGHAGLASAATELNAGTAVVCLQDSAPCSLFDGSSYDSTGRALGRFVAEDVTLDAFSVLFDRLSPEDALTMVLKDVTATLNKELPQTGLLTLWRPDAEIIRPPTLSLVSENVELAGATKFVYTLARVGSRSVFQGQLPVSVTTSCTRIPGGALLRANTAPDLATNEFKFEPLTLAEQLSQCPAFTRTAVPTRTLAATPSRSFVETQSLSRPTTRSLTPIAQLELCGTARLLAWRVPSAAATNDTIHLSKSTSGAVFESVALGSTIVAEDGLALILRYYSASDKRSRPLDTTALQSVREGIRCKASEQDALEQGDTEALCRAFLDRSMAPIITVDDNTALAVRFMPGGSLDIVSDVEILIKLPPSALKCTPNLNFDVVSIHLTAPVPQSVALTRGVTTASAAAAALSGASGTGGPLGDVQALAAFGLISCASSNDRYAMKSASWLLSPTPIGDGPEGFVLFNLVVTFAFFGLQVTLLGLVYGFKKYIRKSAVVNAAVIQGDLRFPSLFVVLAGVFQQGTSILSLRLLLDGRVSFVAVFGAAFSLSFPWMVFVYSQRVARPMFAADISSRLVFFKYEGVGQTWPPRVKAFLMRWILPVGRWGPPLMRKRFGGPIGACMPLWTLFGAVPPLQALGVSIVASVRTGTMAGCMAQYGVLVVMYLVFGTAIIYIRPYRSMFLNVAAAVSSYALVVTLVLQGMMAADPRRPGGHEGKLAVSVFFTSLSYVRMIYGYWLMIAERFLWRSNASKTFWNENRDSDTTSELYEQLIAVEASWEGAFSAKDAPTIAEHANSDGIELQMVPPFQSTN